MKFAILVSILFIVFTAKAQQFVLNNGLKMQYVQEAVLPVAKDAYVVLKDSTAYLYNTTNILPYTSQKLKDSYILNTVENKIYTIDLVQQYVDQIEADTHELITLVTYVYVAYYSNLDSTKINELVKQYGYLIPKVAISEIFKFNETLNLEDNITLRDCQEPHSLLQPQNTNYLKVDENNLFYVDTNENLILAEIKNSKINNLETWTNFNGSISLVSSVKIGDVVRVNFQRYQEESDTLEEFWSIINLKKKTFVAIDLKDFNANLENLQEQDAKLLNSTPFFYKAVDGNNITMLVLPHKNYVWLDDESYYYGSHDLAKYASMRKDDKSYNLKVHAYLFNYPSRILRAIAPQEKEKIKALAEIYVRNKREIISERCVN
ncbi:hypothetical protein P700755_001249 [Psychroflexus torquis ATCC 700755]|uniref:Uncharacterized protein n=1 Tax=Psychroflexus torquis (strain ATCC 700755 / CIP 106069 / ACAM 623) TaxID=313595 RepID=K4IGJ3_PSYTT|nr:hypothetical protein [Psychroflexus torquis]AFU68186.1 hypothetical protein P700755_001249 [Psychroflexus torquis ATCC 700755]